MLESKTRVGGRMREEIVADIGIRLIRSDTDAATQRISSFEICAASQTMQPVNMMPAARLLLPLHPTVLSTAIVAVSTNSAIGKHYTTRNMANAILIPLMSAIRSSKTVLHNCCLSKLSISWLSLLSEASTNCQKKSVVAGARCKN